MDVRHLIALTLAALTASCTGYRCDPEDEDFVLVEVINEADLERIRDEHWIPEGVQVDCETVCSDVYSDQRGWKVQKIDECTLMVEPVAGEDEDVEEAELRCSGRGLEYYCDGRRPLGHIAAALAGDSLAAHLAHSAHLEAASVVAFEEIAAVLRRAEAPEGLSERCSAAAEDERRHAAIVGAYATRLGCTPVSAEQRAVCPSLAELAIDNAREGCVFETWSALRAAWLAENAKEPELRELYAEIAADEAAHAQLSWDLHAWLLRQVDPVMRGKVAEALGSAIRELPRIARQQAAESPRELAMPGVVASSLAGRFAAGLAEAA